MCCAGSDCGLEFEHGPSTCTNYKHVFEFYQRSESEREDETNDRTYVWCGLLSVARRRDQNTSVREGKFLDDYWTRGQSVRRPQQSCRYFEDRAMGDA